MSDGTGRQGSAHLSSLLTGLPTSESHLGTQQLIPSHPGAHMQILLRSVLQPRSIRGSQNGWAVSGRTEQIALRVWPLFSHAPGSHLKRGRNKELGPDTSNDKAERTSPYFVESDRFSSSPYFPVIANAGRNISISQSLHSSQH